MHHKHTFYDCFTCETCNPLVHVFHNLPKDLSMVQERIKPVSCNLKPFNSLLFAAKDSHSCSIVSLSDFDLSSLPDDVRPYNVACAHSSSLVIVAGGFEELQKAKKTFLSQPDIYSNSAWIRRISICASDKPDVPRKREVLYKAKATPVRTGNAGRCPHISPRSSYIQTTCIKSIQLSTHKIWPINCC